LSAARNRIPHTRQGAFGPLCCRDPEPFGRSSATGFQLNYPYREIFCRHPQFIYLLISCDSFLAGIAWRCLICIGRLVDKTRRSVAFVDTLGIRPASLSFPDRQRQPFTIRAC
jgi:hypothetical protein